MCEEKQAARAKVAGVVKHAEFGMALFDLVKAFSRIPHDLLVQEARRLGYNL